MPHPGGHGVVTKVQAVSGYGPAIFFKPRCIQIGRARPQFLVPSAKVALILGPLEGIDVLAACNADEGDLESSVGVA